MWESDNGYFFGTSAYPNIQHGAENPQYLCSYSKRDPLTSKMRGVLLPSFNCIIRCLSFEWKYQSEQIVNYQNEIASVFQLNILIASQVSFSVNSQQVYIVPLEGMIG